MIDEMVMAVSFMLAMMAYSYAFHQRGIWFVIPVGVYVGSFTAYSLFQINRSIQATTIDFITQGQVLLILPLIVGLLAFTRLTKFRWLARYPVAILSGVGVGSLFGLMLQGQLLNPIGDSVASLLDTANDPVSRILLIAIPIPIISMFLYSRKLSDPFYEKGRILTFLPTLGRILFMASVVGYQYSKTLGVGAGIFFEVVKPFLQMIGLS